MHHHFVPRDDARRACPRTPARAIAIRLATPLATPLAIVLAGATAMPSHAAEAPPWTVGAYRGHGVHEPFLQATVQAPFGRTEAVESHETGLVILRDVTPSSWRGRPGGALTWRSQAGLQLYEASGLRSNRAFAIDWRPSVRVSPSAGWSVEAGFGIGWWHAVGTPWYDHHGSPELDAKHHDMLHLVPEIMLRLDALPRWSLGARIDHASGAYGLIAPKPLGSNHIGVVLAVDLDGP